MKVLIGCEWTGVSWTVKSDGAIKLTQVRTNWGHPQNVQPSAAEPTQELLTLLSTNGGAYDYY